LQYHSTVHATKKMSPKVLTKYPASTVPMEENNMKKSGKTLKQRFSEDTNRI